MPIRSTSFRLLLPAVALLSSLALTSCLDKEGDPKPKQHGKCGMPTTTPAPSTTTGSTN